MTSPSTRCIRRFLVLVILALAAARSTPAQTASSRLKLTTTFGFVHAAGNTQLTTLSGDERLEYQTADSLWQLAHFTSVVYGHTNDSTTASQFKMGARAGRSIAKRLSVFGGATLERNRFAGIARRLEEVVGLAIRVVESKRNQLSLEAGASFNQQRAIDEIENNFVAARGALSFKHLLTDAAYFQQLAEFLPNLDEGKDLRINSETALVAPFSRHIAIKLVYTIRFDNLPEPGFKKTDRVFTSGLQVTF